MSNNNALLYSGMNHNSLLNVNPVLLLVGHCLPTKVFIRQIAGYVMGIDDHRQAGDEKGQGPTKLLHALNWGAFNHASHTPQIRAYNYYLRVDTCYSN